MVDITSEEVFLEKDIQYSFNAFDRVAYSGKPIDISWYPSATEFVIPAPTKYLFFNKPFIPFEIPREEVVFEYFDREYTPTLVAMIAEEPFEVGFLTQADNFVQDKIRVNPIVTKSWLNSVFVKYFSQENILLGILRVISRLDFVNIDPEGLTMASLGLHHKNFEVAEASVRCFENWANPKVLEILENIKIKDSWIDSYVKQVISDIRELSCRSSSEK